MIQPRDATPAEAEALREEFKNTSLELDARYAAGYALAYQNDDDEIARRGRELLNETIADGVRANRHDLAAHAAIALTKAAQEDQDLEGALKLANLALSEAERSKDLLARGSAESVRADIYDELGLSELARDDFFNAGEHLKRWPERLALVYVQEGQFLLGLGTPDDLHNAMRKFDRAREHLEAVRRAKRTIRHETEFGLQLNRAAALAELGRLTEATAEIATAEAPLAAYKQKLELVRGYIAARADDLESAEAHFKAAIDLADGPDYEWALATELGLAYERTGRLDEAEAALRRAVEAAEAIRQTIKRPESRPAVLASRARPYHLLVRVLVKQDKPDEALATAELLLARSWLDTVFAGSREAERNASDAVLGVQVARREAPEPLAVAELLAQIGDREVLVFLGDGEALWRAHVRSSDVVLEPLPDDTRRIAEAFIKAPDDRTLAEQAGAALLPPSLAAGEQPLYIVANGVFAGLSFAALRRDGRYLVEQRPVARQLSLTAMTCRSGTWTPDKIYVGDSRGDLRHARAEVERLAGGDARVGAAATVDAIRRARNASLLHVATHGKLLPAGGALVLTDGMLTAAAVVAENIAPQVVVLTGCATAASDDAEAWGGFPSAFLTAGSKYVIATLRSVDDANAAQLARRYYENDDARDPVRQLAAAQRAMIIDGQPASVWGDFAVWGVADCE